MVTHAVEPQAAGTWQHECERLIRQADAVVCIVGDTTAGSPNVEWELEQALRHGAPVLAVRAPAAPAPALPAPLAARRAPLLEPDDLPARLDEVVLERTG